MSGQNAPFAGASRPLCDRKEVTLEDRCRSWRSSTSSARPTSAATYTGIITDDFTRNSTRSRFFGREVLAPNLPVGLGIGPETKSRSFIATNGIWQRSDLLHFA